MFEVGSGHSSPPLAAYTLEREGYVSAYSHSSSSSTKRDVRGRRKEGAAYTITEECERLFCSTMREVFLQQNPGNYGFGSSQGLAQKSQPMGTQINMSGLPNRRTSYSDSEASSSYGSAVAMPVVARHPSFGSDVSPNVVFQPRIMASAVGNHGLVEQFFEVYDYTGGALFRGFTAIQDGKKSMFVFFDNDVLSIDLKPGLMALLEMCSIDELDCSQLVVGIDRNLNAAESKGLHRDLGWVGFEPYTLVEWTGSDDILSDRWLFLNMEV